MNGKKLEQPSGLLAMLISSCGYIPLVKIHYLFGHVGEEKFSSILLGSLAESENETDRLTGGKHMHLFNVTYLIWEPLRGNEEQKEQS